MEKKNLIINVTGEVNSGKSRLILLLKKFLRDNEFEVDFDGGVDYKNEIEFDEYVSKNFNQVIEHIKDTTKITFREIQSNGRL